MSRFFALLASAGTGKTYSLTLHYLARLFEKREPYDILAITFTNKAANEMRERAAKFLQSMDESKLQNISQITQIALPQLSQRVDEVRQSFYASSLNIRTIDSFAQVIVRKFASYAGLSSDFGIAENSALFHLFVDSLDAKSFSDFLDFIKRFEREDIDELFAFLYEKEQELPKLRFFSPNVSEQDVLQIYRKIVDHIQLYGSENKRKSFTTPSSLKDVIYNKSGVPKWLQRDEFKIAGVKNCQMIQQDFEDFKEAVAKYMQTQEAAFLRTLFGFYKLYRDYRQKYVKESEELDFVDIKYIANELLRNHIDSAFLQFRLDARIEYILFDEFQDTSAQDWMLFEPLVDEIYSGKGQREQRGFFLVGDTKQAIYGFRGGNERLFDYVIKKYSMQTAELNMNYRSKSNIVDYVNQVFGLQQKANEMGGYVDVSESEDILQTLGQKLELLWQNGVADTDIAILVPTNDDIVKVSEYIKEQFHKEVTTSSSKLVVHQPLARAIISLLRYQIDENSFYAFEFEAVSGKKAKKFELKKPSIMVKEIADEYALWDRSVKLLLQIATNYRDIYDFLEKIDANPLQMQTTNQGIEVLTIHKSKGLSFAHTIVLDKIGTDRNHSSKIIFDLAHDGIHIRGIYLNIKGREYFDKNFARVKQNYEDQKQKELRNVAYVALTRAKESLILIKKPKSKRFWMAHIYQMGSITPSLQQEQKSQSRFHYSNHYYGAQEVLEEEQEYKVNDYEAIYKGKALHEAMEVGLNYAKRCYKHFVSDQEIEQMHKRAVRVESAFKGKKYREIPFVYNQKLGIIDLLIEQDSSIIIDYKSVKPADERAYIKQVRFYKEAYRKLRNKEAKGYLLYTDKQELKEV